jgi:hypothetical protein
MRKDGFQTTDRIEGCRLIWQMSRFRISPFALYSCRALAQSAMFIQHSCRALAPCAIGCRLIMQMSRFRISPFALYSCRALAQSAMFIQQSCRALAPCAMFIQHVYRNHNTCQAILVRCEWVNLLGLALLPQCTVARLISRSRWTASHRMSLRIVRRNCFASSGCGRQTNTLTQNRLSLFSGTCMLPDGCYLLPVGWWLLCWLLAAAAAAGC